MSLETVFETMHELILGRMSVADAAIRLGLDPESPDGRRLETYRHGYIHAVLKSAEVTFPVTRKVVEAAASPERWSGLVTELGMQHPMREIRFGTAGLVPFLEGPSAKALGLPRWIAELADLELWERRIFLASDTPPHCADHPAVQGVTCPRACLRVTEPLALREYHFDVLAVRRSDDPAHTVPQEGATTVAIWRFGNTERRSKVLMPLPRLVLQEIQSRGAGALPGLLANSDFTTERTLKVLRHLLEVGLLHGALPSLDPV